MEDTDLLKMSGFSAGSVAIILLFYRFLKSVVGKRFISHCCGKKMEVGLDVKENITPQPVTIQIKNPIHKENEQCPA